MEELGVDAAGFLDVLLGEDGGAGGDPADHRQAVFFMAAGFEAGDADAAGGAGGHFDGALACQGLQVFLGGVG
ncbi:hypothetical protein D9M70_650330 [compost metagenome]